MTQTSGAEAEDQLREARAWNYSIYLMISVPYLLVGTFGYMVYRGLKQKPLPPDDTLADGDTSAGQPDR